MNLKNFNISTLFIILLLNISSVFAALVDEDTEITAAVKANLIMAKDIPAKDIQVTTKDRVLEFQGTVDTDQQAKRVLDSVDGVKNVRSIKDGLKVKASGSLLADMLITANAKIQISLLTNDGKIAAGNNLTVETTDKVVHISGTVHGAHDTDTVVEAIRGIKNVKDVKQSIVLKP